MTKMTYCCMEHPGVPKQILEWCVVNQHLHKLNSTKSPRPVASQLLIQLKKTPKADFNLDKAQLVYL